jgi:murein DD-endopeptidase MepM/ murein hydrolase activator NlpD
MLLLYPTTGNIISPFGVSRGGGTRLHEGVDIGAPTGTPIYASAAGRVTHAGWLGSGPGIAVKIAHASGYLTKYFHCSQVHVRVGQQVNAGQLIALVGKTGNASGTAPHLHYEVWINGRAVNPAPLLSNAGAAPVQTPTLPGMNLGNVSEIPAPLIIGAAFLILLLIL